ncbi:uroporphyrinogen-III synthase [Leucobacter allii]|uniref:Uroporphyrinogen-III synthase n=1 Tax=Leucobacter allii TaxID=2932247 RepID=A0ABY4FKL2_9MICO|nr:uroporphyrinogen-III synthase [Leucobacter allii]UOQ56516.1 uroporphyrinogen-III synthase [Leucobacter allii]
MTGTGSRSDAATLGGRSSAPQERRAPDPQDRRSAGSQGRRSAAPLAGLRVLVTSGGTSGERIARAVAERGGTPVPLPLTRTTPPEDPGALEAAVARWCTGGFDWMLVTSARGAAAVRGALAPRDGGTPERIHAGRAGAVGPATAAALHETGIPVGIVPDHDFSAGGLAAAFLAEHPGPAGGGAAQRVLLPLSSLAGGELAGALAAAGHAVERVTAYRTFPAPPRDLPLAARTRGTDPRRPGAPGADASAPGTDVAVPRADASDPGAAASPAGVHAILVASASAAGVLAERAAPIPAAVRVVAIGEPTARALRAGGLDVAAVARSHTALGLVEALVSVAARPPGELPDPDPPQHPHPPHAADSPHDLPPTAEGTPA